MTFRAIVEAALQAVGGDVKALASPRMSTPVGYMTPPSGITGSATGALAFQRQVFVAVDVQAETADGIVINMPTAYSGATAPTLNVALYGTDPATGYPKTDTILASGTLALLGAGTGIKQIAFTAAAALPAGRYWMSSLLNGAAVATAGVFTTQTATTLPYPTPVTLTPGTNVRGLALAGVTALVNTATAPSAFSFQGDTTTPLMYLRRSA